MKAYRYTQDFQVKYYEVDFKDELKISTALSYMEEVASLSAEELGFGYSFVKPRGYAFVVSNNCIQFLKPIRLSALVRMETWPTPPSFAVFGREYRFLDGDGEPFALASSRWCLIDRKTNKILPSKVVEGQDYTTYNTEKVLTEVQWKIPTFQPAEGELCFSLMIANSEYDHNMHVNNTRYADYCLNAFSVAELSEKRLERFCVSYVRQCFEGESLRFYKKTVGDDIYLVHGFNEKDQIVVQSEIRFAKGV